MFWRKKHRKQQESHGFGAKSLENKWKTYVLAQNACNNACNSKACKGNDCNSKACKIKACKKQSLQNAKLAKPALTKAKLPTTTKLAKHCSGFSLRCHGLVR